MSLMASAQSLGLATRLEPLKTAGPSPVAGSAPVPPKRSQPTQKATGIGRRSLTS